MKYVEELEFQLKCKQGRIAQLQADIHNLLRKNAELKQELLVKDRIINKFVIQNSEQELCGRCGRCVAGEFWSRGTR